MVGKYSSLDYIQGPDLTVQFIHAYQILDTLKLPSTTAKEDKILYNSQNKISS